MNNWKKQFDEKFKDAGTAGYSNEEFKTFIEKVETDAYERGKKGNNTALEKYANAWVDSNHGLEYGFDLAYEKAAKVAEDYRLMDWSGEAEVEGEIANIAQAIRDLKQ